MPGLQELMEFMVFLAVLLSLLWVSHQLDKRKDV